MDAGEPRHAIEEVRASLDTVADAIAAADLDRLVSVEERLGRAVSRLMAVRAVPAADRAGVRDEILRTRAAIERCRCYGALVERLSAVYTEALGGTTGYTRSGSTAAADARIARLDSRG